MTAVVSKRDVKLTRKGESMITDAPAKSIEREAERLHNIWWLSAAAMGNFKPSWKETRWKEAWKAVAKAARDVPRET